MFLNNQQITEEIKRAIKKFLEPSNNENMTTQTLWDAAKAALRWKFIAIWSEKMLDTISIFLNLLRFDFWPKMWSILENVPCAIEKKVILLYLYGMSWRYRWDPSHLMYHLRLFSLLIFCFDVLSIGVSGVLKSSTTILLLSISPFMSVSVYFMYWGAPMLGA